MRRDEAAQQRIPLPVISIGGLTVGGAGKTPFANYLASELRERGHHPAILTRGYRRRTPARNIVLAPGTVVSPALTGDEAQIFLRAGDAAVGIGANRAETGRLLMQHHPVDIILLDDGFQHRRLYRDIDIVLIDGLMPFGRLHTVPLGLLREPLNALERADILVVTRAEHTLRFELIAKKLREYNSRVPIFRAFTQPKQWRLYREKIAAPVLPFRRVAAFCGIGNPQGFWNTLSALNLEIVFNWSFPDHHLYQQHELRRMASQAENAGAEILVTTEKDRVNLPRDFLSNVAPFDVAWLEIENTMEHKEEFFAWLERRLGARLEMV
jgi:tetraacyldisaccharide 4'-kinase